jgi:hypothetical protein
MKKIYKKQKRSNSVRFLNSFNEYSKLCYPKAGLIQIASLFIDSIWCYAIYGAYPNNYFEYKFAEKRHDLRKYIVTRRHARHFIYTVNGNEVNMKFRDKSKFNTIFSSFIHREWIDMKSADIESFKGLISRHEKIFVKPSNGMFGADTLVINSSEIKSVNELYEQYSGRDVLFEEYITACNEISELHPASLNTIKVHTFNNNGKVTFINAVLRIGQSGAIVDNIHGSVGMMADIDLNRGVIISKAISLNGNTYSFHPDSGKQIVGMEIPNWDKIKSLVAELSKVVPETPFVGWDIAIMLNGCLEVIEGNDRPDFTSMQMPTGHGILPFIDRLKSDFFGKGKD